MKIGLALGGGGVRGLAHIPVLELLDELKIRPDVIAGTSMGAIMGALYASGLSGKDIRKLVEKLFILKRDTWRDIMAKRKDLLKLAAAFKADFKHGGLLSTHGFMEYLVGEIKKRTFEELEIPLLVVAADFWAEEEVVFEKDGLIPAVQASMAVPGVFAPVLFGGKVLMDGGILNPVPYEHLLERCDFTIAVNVNKVRSIGKREIPTPLESLLGTLNMMQSAALVEKLKRRKPDIYVQPEFRGIRLLDLNKADQVFQQAEAAVELLRMQLENKLLRKG